ncbi:hypothetical protein OF83DRAFT_1176613 [Amylostereum chailletii]|nr:hypothetical protein OF83DRAFT_1176613 [Amylostereum chailletii]
MSTLQVDQAFTSSNAQVRRRVHKKRQGGPPPDGGENPAPPPFSFPNDFPSPTPSTSSFSTIPFPTPTRSSFVVPPPTHSSPLATTAASVSTTDSTLLLPLTGSTSSLSTSFLDASTSISSDTSPSSTSTSSSSISGSGALSTHNLVTGAIIGGAVAGVLLLVTITFLVVRHRRHRADLEAAHSRAPSTEFLNPAAREKFQPPTSILANYAVHRDETDSTFYSGKDGPAVFPSVVRFASLGPASYRDSVDSGSLERLQGDSYYHSPSDREEQRSFFVD